MIQAIYLAMRECKYKLTLADILERMPGRLAGISADAAWEIAMESELWEESKTVVVPMAVFSAFPVALWEQGDNIGARMVFKAAYPDACRAHGTEVHVSLGWHEEERERVVRDAVADGRLSAAQARQALPHVAGRALQVEGPPVERGMPSEIREQLQAIVGRWGEPKSKAEVRKDSNEAQRKLRERWAGRETA